MGIKDQFDKLTDKAEARSERIEGKIREKLGKYSDDPEAIEAGQEKQAKAEEIEREAEQK